MTFLGFGKGTTGRDVTGNGSASSPESSSSVNSVETNDGFDVVAFKIDVCLPLTPGSGLLGVFVPIVGLLAGVFVPLG